MAANVISAASPRKVIAEPVLNEWIVISSMASCLWQFVGRSE